jgi:RNA polymerase sigma-70 factor (ECF subfamily)
MSDEEDRWERLIQGLRTGDRLVLQDFWDQYGPMLQRVAEKNLAEGMRRRLGPEDVVQSVCRTFFRRAHGGEFKLADTEELWRLLCAITLTKIREKTRFHLRKKRGLDQEQALAAGGDDSPMGWDPVAPGPTPAEAAEFSDQFQQMLAGLDEEEKQIVDLKLQDYTHDEVADKLGCSERTVRRVLKRVQGRLLKVFEL